MLLLSHCLSHIFLNLLTKCNRAAGISQYSHKNPQNIMAQEQWQILQACLGTKMILIKLQK